MFHVVLIADKGRLGEIAVALLLLSEAQLKYRVPNLGSPLSKIFVRSFATTFGSHPLPVDGPKSVYYQEPGIHFEWKEHVAIPTAQAKVATTNLIRLYLTPSHTPTMATSSF